MQKIILSIFILCSIFNIINSMEMDQNNNNNTSTNNNYFELPIAIWGEIAVHLIDINLAIKNLEIAKTIPECGTIFLGIMKRLQNFALVSKKHFLVAKYLINQYKFEINDKKVTLKEYYAHKKMKLFQRIKEILIESKYKYRFNDIDTWFTDINAQNKDGWTVLMFVVSFPDRKLIELLIQNGANLDIQDMAKGTALIIASIHNHKEIAELLIQYGANLDIQTEMKMTALMYAVECNSKEVAELLIQNGANINIQNKYGQTALMFSVIIGNYEIVELLIQSGADVNIKDIDGRTALIIARTMNHKDIVELIEEKNQSNQNNNNFESKFEYIGKRHECVVQ